ncbi:hypothetical protein ESCO_000355 [Escovopsis weberi]|uniref:Uncharacterized protein n=1 Tax=Escovopsis weberi TaxID=150374 RepID=A0A0M9VTQ8_ESCWE|nr:hypothetical protein ESCO_000355 [Escovopsis weberi]
MIAKDCKRLALFGLPVLILIYTAASFYRDILPVGPPAHDEPKSAAPWEKGNHMEVFSASTHDRKYFPIDFGEIKGMNPNIIPHPHLEETWIVVAQESRGPDVQDPVFAEIACNAAFRDGTLRCISPPARLPIAPTAGDKCTGELAFFGLNAGPHDARVLYGPDKPYVVYGSNSALTCFGQWIHDFRELVGAWADDDGDDEEGEKGEEPEPQETPDLFRAATELQRPAAHAYGAVEKNWFPFWDRAGRMYVHYDMSPRRVFARIHADGSAGEDLATATAAADARCLARYVPALPPALESVHQATNSLSVTMCRRADPRCVPGAHNTFVLAVWQHKTFYRFHGVYEPYAMLFRRDAPFAVHAVSRRPLWIHGREEHRDRQTSDMMYVTSVSWKHAGLKYHGFLDDELVLGFGIEDRDSGGIDLVAGDLLANLGLCDD